MNFRKITFVGAGNMVKSIVSGLVSHGYPAEQITACAPSLSNRYALHEQFKIHHSDDTISYAQQAEVIVLAVKPQMMVTVCQQLHSQVGFQGKLVLSIAAGVTIQRFYQLLGEDLNIIRIMPNTPALIGQGMSGLYSPPQVKQSDRLYCEKLMRSVGDICWLDKEEQINEIIAIAGSAPAYFFLFMESMQKEAERLGFDQEQASRLIRQTALGSVMLANHAEVPFSTLRQQVTSKGGTTAEAINVFQQHHIDDTIAKAMQAAIKRAKELELTI